MSSGEATIIMIALSRLSDCLYPYPHRASFPGEWSEAADSSQEAPCNVHIAGLLATAVRSHHGPGARACLLVRAQHKRLDPAEGMLHAWDAAHARGGQHAAADMAACSPPRRRSGGAARRPDQAAVRYLC
eukprot:6172856-Pleurochrysis_carterae.AAC.2